MTFFFLSLEQRSLYLEPAVEASGELEGVTVTENLRATTRVSLRQGVQLISVILNLQLYLII